MPEATLTNQDVQRSLPDLDARKATIVLIDERIYKNEDGHWRALDDRTRRSTAELTGTEGDNGRCRVEVVDGSS